MSDQPKPSAQYKFAKNPIAEIRRAVLRTLEERSDNPRVSWKALLTSAGVDSDGCLSIEQFTYALKNFGTGIQLTPVDVYLVMGSDASVNFESYTAFVAGSS